MNEQELRTLAKSEELEKIDIHYFFSDNYTGKPNYIGVAIFDYDRGLSILEKGNTDHCLVGIHGPEYKGNTTYHDMNLYIKELNHVISMIKTGKYWAGGLDDDCLISGIPTCSFT